MKSYSNSKLETFDQCKLKYKLKYIDKVPVPIPITIEAFLGDLVHKTLQQLYSLSTLAHPELKTLLEFYHTEWNKTWQDEVLIAKPNTTPQHYKKLGEKFIIDYYFKHTPFNQAETLSLETQELVPLDEERNYHIRIDRLSHSPKDSTFEIHDYKTSNTLKTPAELASDTQLPMYSLWVKHKFPNARKIKLTWHFLAFNTELTLEKSESEIEKTKQQILKKIHEIESTTQFPASLTPLCDYCLFKDICPEFKK